MQFYAFIFVAIFIYKIYVGILTFQLKLVLFLFLYVIKLSNKLLLHKNEILPKVKESEVVEELFMLKKAFILSVFSRWIYL